MRFVDRFRRAANPSAKRGTRPRFAERAAGAGGFVDETRAIRVAAGQDGVISTRQLAAAGVSRDVAARRVAAGTMRRLHRGVYLYGAVAGPHADEWAALLACGPRAVLSHFTALALWRLADAPSVIDVTHPGDGRPHHGVRRHRAAVEARDLARRHGLPVTALPRTLLDVASSVTAVELARLIEEAQVQRLVTRAQLFEALARGRNRAGAPALRKALHRDEEPSMTRSEAERRLRGLVRAARLPRPGTNVRVGRHEVDVLWRDQRLVVEIDGFAFHGSRAAFERDRRRDAELTALGYRVIRVTWRQLTGEPEAVIATVAAALSAARSA